MHHANGSQRAARRGAAAAALWLLAVACAPAGDCPDLADAAVVDAAAPAGELSVGLYDGEGIWPEGRTAIAAALEGAPVTVVPISAAELRAGDLDRLDAIIMGGGYAWDQWNGLGAAGISAVRAFVLAGGGYLGICAGAYLASDDVVWEREWVAYPLNLFDGVAEGPLAAYPWPESAVIEVQRVPGSHPLQGDQLLDVYYQGGAALLARDPAAVTELLHYQDGATAGVALTAGAGRVVLTGVHLEIPLGDGADEVRAELLKRFVLWSAGSTP